MTKPQKMTVAYCANRKIYPQIPTTLNSLLTHNSDNIEKIYLLIEDDELETVRHPKVEIININQFDFVLRKNFNCTKQFPYMAMARCYFTKILKEDKVLYLDIDTVVTKNLMELWNWSLGANCIAAKMEYDALANRHIPKGYFNSGVMLMNLKLIRGLHLDDAWIRLITSCKFMFPDQDSANIVFKNRISYLPDKFNTLGDEVDISKIAIRHFAGQIKPWKDYAKPQDKKLWDFYKVDYIDVK